MKKVILNKDTDDFGLVEGKRVRIYPRKCYASGEGMLSGFCVNDGEYYVEDEEELETLLEQLGYVGREKAYEDEVYYYTDWYDWQYSEGDVVYTLEGEELEVTFK